MVSYLFLSLTGGVSQLKVRLPLKLGSYLPTETERNSFEVCISRKSQVMRKTSWVIKLTKANLVFRRIYTHFRPGESLTTFSQVNVQRTSWGEGSVFPYFQQGGIKSFKLYFASSRNILCFSFLKNIFVWSVPSFPLSFLWTALLCYVFLSFCAFARQKVKKHIFVNLNLMIKYVVSGSKFIFALHFI